MNAKAVFWGLTLLIAGAALGAGAILGAGAERIPDVARALGISPGGATKPAEKGHGDAHAGHGEGEAGHKEGEELRLTPEQIRLAGIETAPAKTGELPVEISLNGEVTLDRDRVVEIVPQVPGIARQVSAKLGDEVRAGAVLAVIDSRELADAWAEWLSARERVALAQSRFGREERLRQKKITAEQEFQEAREALASAQIEQRTAENKLRALGVTGLNGTKPPPKPDEHTRYPVTSPLAGTVIEKRVTEGEHVEGTAPIFRLAQLDRLWVLANVYQKDVARVKVGQEARITVRGYGDKTFTGKIAWIAAMLDEKTRTLQVRVEIDNRERLLRAGVFASVHVAVERKSGIILPASAVTAMKGRQTVFIAESEGRFEPREVVVGSRAGDRVEIAWGLDEGESVVTSGAFLLKSEIEKAGFEAGHAH